MKDTAIFLALTADLIAQKRFISLVTETNGIFGDRSISAHTRLTRELALSLNYALPYEQSSRIKCYDNINELRCGLQAVSAWLRDVSAKLYGDPVPATKTVFRLVRGENLLRKATNFLWSDKFEQVRASLRNMTSPDHPEYLRGVDLAYVTDVLVGLQHFVVAKDSLVTGVEHPGLHQVIDFAMNLPADYWRSGYIMDLLAHDRITLADANAAVALRLSKTWVSTKVLYPDSFAPNEAEKLPREDDEYYYFSLQDGSKTKYAA